MQLYTFQQQAIQELQHPGKHICLAGVGVGKGAISLHWLKNTNKQKWLFVTTSSKRDSGDVQQEAYAWFGEQSLSSISLEVISWAGLAKWTMANWNSLEEYAFVFDEVAKGKSGVGSARGRAFLQITKRTDCWTGYTATPGDTWADFHAYFIAGGYLKNKTQFMREFCNVQTYKGFPEIVGYYHEDILQKWWQEMTVCPDTSAMQRELPPERHYVINFKPDSYYKKLAKTHTTIDGEFLETAGAYCAACRKLNFTKEKRQWLLDYLEGLGDNAVLFYNFTEIGDALEALAYKALPKEAKVWRISGKTHDIPRADTIGKYDVVICQWQAGAEALNLQFINQWVSVDPCYAYSTSEQARGRIKRHGQSHDKMEFYYLRVPETIDDAIYLALKSKSTFAEDNWFAEQGASM